MKKRLTPWQRIVRAAKNGHGVRFSYEDVWRLNMDDAITTRATNDDLGINAEGDPLPEPISVLRNSNREGRVGE